MEAYTERAIDMSEENQAVEGEQQDLGITFDEGTEEEQLVAEPGATPAPPEEEKEEGKDEKTLTFDEKQQEFINGKINEKTRETGEERRKREAAERKAAELEAKLNELQKTGRPEVPPMPDPYDPKYQELVEERDAKLAEAAQWDANEQYMQQQQLQAQEEAARAYQKKMQETVETYTARAKDLGVDQAVLAGAGQTISTVGIHDALAAHILNDPLGPQVTVHLANNLQELQTLNQMDPLQAAIYIHENIKPGLKPKEVEQPPPPPEHLTGQGAREGERGPKGATYE